MIYEQRRAVLEGQDLSDEVRQWIEEVVEGAVDQFATEEGEGWDLDLLCEAMHTLYGSDVSAAELREDFSGSFDRQALVDDFSEDAQEAYGRRSGSWEPSSYASSSAT